MGEGPTYQDLSVDSLWDMARLADYLFTEGPLPLAVVDQDLRYVRGSRLFGEVLNCESANLTGKEVFPHGFKAEHQTIMKRALEEGRPTVLKNWTLKTGRPDQWETGCWQWAVSPLHVGGAGVLGLLLSGTDVTDRRRLETEVIERAAQERREVNREIHDNVSQLLTAISVKAQLMQLKLEGREPVASLELQEMRDLIRSVMGSYRRIAHLLHPQENEAGGFLRALEGLAEDTELSEKVSCQIRLPVEEPSMEPVQVAHIYALVQDVIQHAVHQAGAHNLSLRFSIEPECFVIEVTHDGRACASTNTVDGYGMMVYHAHTIAGTLTMKKGKKGRVTFTGRFPKVLF